MQVEIRKIQETTSTNSYMMEHMDEFKGQYSVVMAEKQTAGRGLDGNTWESEEGKNLLFSLLFRPDYIQPKNQFVISMAISMAIMKVMSRLFPKKMRWFSVKWPNDIYYKHNKVGGILIENKLRGDKIEASVVGVGLNVNQLEFLSDAPNPISLIKVNKGKELSREEVLDAITESFFHKMDFMEQHSRNLGNSFFLALASALTENYNEALYWNDDEYHPFRDANGKFKAKIMEVKRDGRLWLETSKGEKRSYWLKEVQFLNIKQLTPETP